MSKSKANNTGQQMLELTQDLLSLHDEYLELQECSAFLHDAAVAIVESENHLTQYSINGLRHHSRNIKMRLAAFGENLETLRHKYSKKS